MYNTGRFGRDSSSSSRPGLTSHFSVSLDYGSDSPLSVDQINFNSFKEKDVSGSEVFVAEATEALGTLSYRDAVGKSTNLVSIIL